MGRSGDARSLVLKEACTITQETPLQPLPGAVSAPPTPKVTTNLLGGEEGNWTQSQIKHLLRCSGQRGLSGLRVRVSKWKILAHLLHRTPGQQSLNATFLVWQGGRPSWGQNPHFGLLEPKLSSELPLHLWQTGPLKSQGRLGPPSCKVRGAWGSGMAFFHTYFHGQHVAEHHVATARE